LAEAEGHYNQCVSGYEKLAERYPASIDYAFDLAMIKNSLGIVLSQLRPAEAEALYLQAIAIWQRYAKELPNDPVEFPRWLALSRSNLAHHLTCNRELSVRNPRRALELVKQGLELAPQESSIWHNLGVAHYRLGDWPAALPALQKAVDLSKGNSS